MLHEQDKRPPVHLGAKDLFVAHARFVANFLVKLAVRPAEVDDLVQEVFLVAHRHGGFAGDRGRPTTWLASIAIRVAANARRTRRRRHEDHGDETIERCVAKGKGPHESLEVSESLARVNRALDALDLDQRALFVLFEIEGETCEAIALGLGVPIGTVYSRLHRARRDFQREYSRLLGRQPSVPAPIGSSEGVCR
jgi:RNA polymerase sigma-70 factor (ECF subfamily)